MSLPPIWPVGPIPIAGNTKLNENPGTLPQHMDTVSNWFQLLQFDRITKTLVNFQVTETTEPVAFQGVVVTSPNRKLQMTASGQRLWVTKSIFCWPNVPLNPDDVVVYLGVQYRVLEGADYAQYGIQEYFLAQDYTGSGPTDVSE